MARMTVPGLKASTGISEFLPLVAGDYIFAISKVEVKPPKNPAPMDVWHFSFEVLEGPKQANGKAAKSCKHWITIKQPMHPAYDPEKTYAVDELKSIIVAAGVTIGKNDDINPDSFAGLKIKARVTQVPNYADASKMDNKFFWMAAD